MWICLCRCTASQELPTPHTQLVWRRILQSSLTVQVSSPPFVIVGVASSSGTTDLVIWQWCFDTSLLAHDISNQLLKIYLFSSILLLIQLIQLLRDGCVLSKPCQWCQCLMLHYVACFHHIKRYHTLENRWPNQLLKHIKLL